MKISSKNTIQIIVVSLSDFVEQSLPLIQAKRISTTLNTNHQYTFWKDHLRTEVGIVLTERLLLNEGISEKIINSIKRNSFGKPFLPDHTVDFNISHSGNYVVAVYSTHQQIGIDVEQNRSIDLSLYESIFHPQELTFLQNEDSPNAFFEVWTKKESLLKAKGTGFQVDLAKVNVLDDSVAHSYFHQVQIPGYTCFVCSTFPCQNVSVSYCNTQNAFLSL
jgi:phosphopantetheinyl transferase